LVALFAGALGAWGVMHFVMDADYLFEPLSALGVIFGGILATLLAGLVFVLRPLARRPAGVLRSQD
jgi:putative ABC transport system permease protein